VATGQVTGKRDLHDAVRAVRCALQASVDEECCVLICFSTSNHAYGQQLRTTSVFKEQARQ
jgi:hypothetical protein